MYQQWRDLKKHVRNVDHDHEVWHETLDVNTYSLTPEEMDGAYVVDVGANIGAFTAACCSLGAKVLAIEPSTENLAVLRVNTAGMDCEIHEAALWDVARRGSVKFQYFSGSPAASRLQKSGTDEVELVDFETLMAYSPKDIDYLKLDCEGAEWDAIMYASTETLRRCKRITAELHLGLRIGGPEHTVPGVYRRMRQAGFDVLITPGAVMQFNWLMHAWREG